MGCVAGLLNMVLPWEGSSCCLLMEELPPQGRPPCHGSWIQLKWCNTRAERLINSWDEEAISEVPAHGDYLATRFIMIGRTSNSPVAGKMVVSTERVWNCSWTYDDKKWQRKWFTRNKWVKKIYRINSNIREVTEEEQESLSENRRNACEGKTVVTSSIETISEEEYLERSDFAKSINASSKRVKRYSRPGVCNNLFVRRFTEFKDNNSTVYCSMDREITNSL